MKNLLLFCLLFFVKISFGQYATIYASSNQAICDEDVAVQFQIEFNDPSLLNSPTTLHIEWLNGLIEDIPVITNFNGMSNYIDTTIEIIRSSFYVNTNYTSSSGSAELRYSNGTTVPNSTFQLDYIFNSQCNYSETIHFNYSQFNNYISQLSQLEYDFISTEINIYNIVDYSYDINVVQTNIDDYTLKLNSTWLQTNNVTTFPEQYTIQNGILDMTYWNSYYTNVNYWYNSFYNGIIVSNTLTSNNGIADYWNNSGVLYNIDLQALDTINTYLRLINDSINMPDTNLIVHIENPQNIFSLVPGNYKNLTVGNGFIEFQPRIGDYFVQSFPIPMTVQNPSLLSYGQINLPVYFINSSDSNTSDDSTFLHFFINESCMGNTGTDVDLSINCSSYLSDTTLYYEVMVSKDICDSVGNIQMIVNFPTNAVLDTNYLSAYSDRTFTYTDSTVTVNFNMSQYLFEDYIDFPFATSSLFVQNTNFEVEISCVADTNGIEYCNHQPDFSTCNQIDTAEFYAYELFNNLGISQNSFILQGSINLSNCDSSIVTQVQVTLPTGVSLISNTLSNATVSGQILTFDLTNNIFDIPLQFSQSNYGQMLGFPFVFSNSLDTNVNNNAETIFVQIPQDPCSDATVANLGINSWFNNSANHFEMNLNNYCFDTIQVTLDYGNNLIPATFNLLNPVISGNQLTFDLPNNGQTNLDFDYFTFVSSGIEPIQIRVSYPFDSDTTNNSDSIYLYFSYSLCDSIDANNQSFGNANMVAPTTSGNIYLYPEIQNCSETLQATVELMPWMTPDLSNLPGASYSGNTITLPPTIFLQLNSNYIHIPVSIPGTIPATTPYEIYVTYSNGLDQSSYNNVDTIADFVLNSYDPNEKLCDKASLLSPSVSEKLTYEIHFQNDGNYPALNITVLDTLDTDLDLSTFKFLSSKHYCEVSIDSTTRVARFFFPYINLGPSGVDLDSSQGVFFYEIQENSTVPSLAQIENTAYIYFDYNPPIVTNTTFHENGYLSLEETMNENQLTVYPNPVSTHLYLESSSEMTDLKLVSLDGRIHFEHSTWTESFLNVSELPNGIYVLSAIINGSSIQQRVIVQH